MASAVIAPHVGKSSFFRRGTRRTVVARRKLSPEPCYLKEQGDLNPDIKMIVATTQLARLGEYVHRSNLDLRSIYRLPSNARLQRADHLIRCAIYGRIALTWEDK